MLDIVKAPLFQSYQDNDFTATICLQIAPVFSTGEGFIKLSLVVKTMCYAMCIDLYFIFLIKKNSAEDLPGNSASVVQVRSI